MKTSIKSMAISGLVAIALVFSTSCENEKENSENAQYARILDVASDGTTSVIGANAQSAFVETTALTDSELASLLKMKEEEKLARDVYSVLYQKWGIQIFSRISTAENNHLNAIVLLLKYYNSADTATAGTGVFANTNMQALYNDLVSKASDSINLAYKTGAMIEEMDITDLKKSLDSTSNENIKLVFDNLLKGSRNHLRAYNRQLTSLGLVYTPIYLSQSDYTQIVNSEMEKGNQYKMKGKGNGQGKGGNGNGSCNM